MEAPSQEVLLCGEPHNHQAVPLGKGGGDCQGPEEKRMLEVYCFENSSGIYLRHPWPSRSTGRNIEDSTEEHTGTVLLKHPQDRRNVKDSIW